MTKRALITGITGQDGAYLAEHLLQLGYHVLGGERRSSITKRFRLDELQITNSIEFIAFDLTDQSNMLRILEKADVSEVYNLAGQSYVPLSFEQPIMTSDVSGLGVTRLLEAIRASNANIRFYQASTSEIFGNVNAVPQSESTAFHPNSPYGVAKLYAHCMTANYREAFGVFGCSGISFNHESPLRGVEFVSRKISLAAARIKHGVQQKLHLGNLCAQRDWGYAREYVEAMHLMLQQANPDDYVLATGFAHTVEELVETAFSAVGLEWHDHVVIDPELSRPVETDVLVGDASKAAQTLGWQAKTQFNELVEMMVDADLRRVASGTVMC